MSILIPRFPDVRDVWDADDERQFRRRVDELFTGLARLVTPAPLVRVTVVRDGVDRDITLDVVDPLRQFISMEYQLNGGGWVTTWTSSTTGVQYNKTLTLTIGLDYIFEYRLRYRDEDGQAKYQGGALGPADLQSVDKTIWIPYSELKGITETEPYDLASGYLTPNSTGATRTYVCGVTLPVGATLSSLQTRMYRAAVGDSAVCALWRGDGSSGLATKVAENSHSTTGWQDQTDSDSPLPDTIGSNVYTLVVQLFSSSAAGDSRFLKAGIGYTSSNYSQA